MLKNFLRIAIKRFLKNKLFLFISIIGLAIGMAVCLLALEYVRYEKSYDEFLKNSERIYRVNTHAYTGKKLVAEYGCTMQFVGPALESDFTGISTAVRLHRHWHMNIKYRDNKFMNKRIFATDASFVELFSLPMLDGDAKTALVNPQTMVVSESLAKTLFGDQDPMGQVLKIQWGVHQRDYAVTGVFRDIPHNSHLDIDVLISIHDLSNWSTFTEGSEMKWYYPYFQTYVLLKPGVDPGVLEEKFPAFIEKYAGAVLKKYGDRKIYLQPVRDIHLGPGLKWSMGGKGSKLAVNITFWGAVALLLFSLINFLNVSTVNALDRVKEIYVRKVVGADRAHFFKYFFVESVLYALMALILTVIIILFSLNYINRLFNITLSISLFGDWHYWLNLIVLIVFIGVFLGIFLVVVHSPDNFNITRKNDYFRVYSRGKSLREIFIILQYIITFVLMASIFVINKQIQFLLNTDPGFRSDNVVIFAPTEHNSSNDIYKSIQFAGELKKSPLIEDACFAPITPGQEHQTSQSVWRRDKGDKVDAQTSFIDCNFLDTYEIKFLAGRNFSFKKYISDLQSVIINESLMRALGFSSPDQAIDENIVIDHALQSYLKKGEYRIIGVIKDYNQRVLKYRIQPAKFHLALVNKGVFSVKLNTTNTKEAIDLVTDFGNMFFFQPDFVHFFLEDNIKEQYKSDIRLKNIISGVTFLAIAIACLGLLGMSSYVSVLRTKEIAIRKVFGAGPGNIFLHLSKNFIKPIVTAIGIAFPIAYFTLNKFLENYAYRIDMSLWLFVLPLLIILAVSLLILGGQLIIIDRVNPIDSLRNE